MQSIYDLTYEQMQAVFASNGFKKFRGEQCFKWIYQKHVQRFEEMQNIGKDAISFLNTHYEFDTLKLVYRQVSKDKTVKYLFELKDGYTIETVLMHFSFGKSVCVTSQIGCNMGCRFCASGLLKKQRNLTAGEIVAQVAYVNRELSAESERVRNIVVMGIGEPFDNYDNVMDFCKIINDDRGFSIGARHITISTCGIVPKIYQFADENVQYNLAISLHAPTDEQRSAIMPINRSFSLEKLFKALAYYSEKNSRRLTFEYILLKGVNDSEEDAIKLAKLVAKTNGYVNLIPYNQVDENGYKTTDEKVALKFYDTLMKHHVKATLRSKHGDDIDAACGQLRAKHERVLK